MCRTTTCSNGQTGPPGRDGRDGLPGRDCTQGLLGLNGTQGPIGPQGPQGIDGLNGTEGAIGSQGPPGIDGLNGTDGAIGSQGPPGIDGLNGIQGPIGSQGPPGRDGLNGIQGSTGPQGPIGPQGLQGTEGVDGTQGPIGPQGPVGPAGPTIGGVGYTRWGNSACPNIAGTELVYTGRAGGTHYNQIGGGANYLCLPMDPEYALPSRGGVQGYSPIWGAEYQYPVDGEHDHDVPCAVCHVTTRLTVLMIPAKASCPTSWTEEYDGYLMADHIGSDHSRTMFVCVDRAQESIPGTSADINGATFHNTEADCTGLPCPPYNNEQELNCVVCTK